MDIHIQEPSIRNGKIVMPHLRYYNKKDSLFKFGFKRNQLSIKIRGF